MKTKNKKYEGWLKRKKRVRVKVSGTSEAPRLTVFKSNKYLYVQAIDDVNGLTLAHASTLVKGDAISKGISAAEKLGEIIAENITKKGIKALVFDKNGYKYHGTIKALADKVREKGEAKGLKF